ncbi:hypothetical protein EYF80_037535 [Liparis tanakae]|uniref:Uncharacterized protein n=1 Tax=Liparis tanakae TaxID=230148 RepID=A0A4Z2GFS9_9TELE|nr:hypothetical protein EYF80_037535 [Liparis tanakae]
MVHIRVSWYTASKPWLTDWASRAANSWLLKIFRLQPGGKTQHKQESGLNHEPQLLWFHSVQTRVLAQLHRPQLVVGLQVGPAPQAAVDDVGQTFSVGHLQTAIQRPAERRRGRRRGAQKRTERQSVMGGTLQREELCRVLVTG